VNDTSLHVLHVTETLATGVLDVVARMAKHQTSLGHRVTILHTPRPETPSRAVLEERIGAATLVTVGDAKQHRLTRLRLLRSAFVEMAAAVDVDVIHLHSSFAGVVGRLGRNKPPTIYSPHGFAFLRRDVSPLKARAFRAVEAFLARRSDAVLCVSSGEECVAQTELRASTLLVPNRVSIDELTPRPARLQNDKPIIVNVGRWSPQKAPERFVNAARRFCEVARFRWIGDGPSALGPELSVTGWMEPDEVVAELSGASLIYFTSRWEGMPVGLMQAQALGVPAVALRCVGVEDIVIDGVTGVIVDDEASAHRALRSLIDDPASLAAMRAATVASRERFSDSDYGDDLMSAYLEVISRHA